MANFNLDIIHRFQNKVIKNIVNAPETLETVELENGQGQLDETTQEEETFRNGEIIMK